MDWKPNAAYNRLDRESNPELIGAKRGNYRCVNPLPLPYTSSSSSPSFSASEQAISRFLHAHRSSASVAISSADISTS